MGAPLAGFVYLTFCCDFAGFGIIQLLCFGFCCELNFGWFEVGLLDLFWVLVCVLNLVLDAVCGLVDLVLDCVCAYLVAVRRCLFCAIVVGFA